MEFDRRKIEDRAWGVLRMNNRGTHTVPSGGNKEKSEMYGHAWLWDSAAHSIGIAHRDPEFAANEINHILESQWSNGMIPNMRFKPGSLDKYVWLSQKLNPHSHETIHTSGITQPPILAEAVQRVSERMNDHGERQAFAGRAVARLVAFHEWLYSERDVAKNGGIVTLHPWEHGHDNSPRTMEPLKRHDHGVLGLAAKAIYGIVHPFRHDLKNVSANQRASKEEGRLLAVAFIKLLMSGYDVKRIGNMLPLHEDVHMNSILIRNNQVLGQLADEYGIDIPDELQANMRKSLDNLETMWDSQDRMYYNKNTYTGELEKIPTSGSLEPLYIGELLPANRIAALLEHIRNPETFGGRYGIPSVALNSPYYREQSYWSGPGWTYPEWEIQDGLWRAGRHMASKEIASASIKRAVFSDFHEYASVESAEGLGASDFSWSAAHVIDMMKRHYPISGKWGDDRFV